MHLDKAHHLEIRTRRSPKRGDSANDSDDELDEVTIPPMAAGIVGNQLFEQISCDAYKLFCSPGCSFPTGTAEDAFV